MTDADPSSGRNNATEAIQFTGIGNAQGQAESVGFVGVAAIGGAAVVVGRQAVESGRCGRTEKRRRRRPLRIGQIHRMLFRWSKRSQLLLLLLLLLLGLINVVRRRRMRMRRCQQFRHHLPSTHGLREKLMKPISTSVRGNLQVTHTCP